MNRTDTLRTLYGFSGEGGRIPKGLVSAAFRSGIGAPRSTMAPHLIESGVVAAIVDGRYRFAAHWLCGSGSSNAVPITDADGMLCERCEARHLDRIEGLNCVYRCFAEDGSLLYVGSTTIGVRSRLAMHERNSRWWKEVDNTTVERFPTAESARSAELQAIRIEHPIHNIHHRRRGAA